MRVAQQLVHLIERADNPVPHLRVLSRKLALSERNQPLPHRVALFGGVQSFKIGKNRRKLLGKRSRAGQALVQFNHRLRQSLPNRFQLRAHFRVPAAQGLQHLARPQPVARDIAQHAVALVVRNGGIARQQQRAQVCVRAAEQPHRFQQEPRQRMPVQRTALRREQRNFIFGKGSRQRVHVLRGVAHKHHDVAIAPAVFHGQPARERRREARFLHGISKRRKLHRGVPGAIDLRRRTEHLARQKARRVRRIPGFVQAFTLPLDSGGVHCPQQALIGSLKRPKQREIARVSIVFQRKKHRRVPDEPGKPRDEIVPDRRSQIEAEGKHRSVPQRRRAGKALHGLANLILAILKPPGQRFLIGRVQQGEVVHLPLQRAVPGFLGQRKKRVRINARLLKADHFLHDAHLKAAAIARPGVPFQLFFQTSEHMPHQKRPSAVVDTHTLRPPRFIEDAVAQALRRKHHQPEGTDQVQPLQQAALGIQRQLLRHHHHDGTALVGVQRLRHRPQQRRLQRRFSPRVKRNAHRCFSFSASFPVRAAARQHSP